MVRLLSVLRSFFLAFLCACGSSQQNPTDSGAAGQGGSQATSGTAGGAGAKGDHADAAGSPGDAAIDASVLPPCPEIVAAKFGQVGSNCLRGCEVPQANDSGILGIIPVCRLTDANARTFALSQPAYCVLQDATTFLCTGADASP
jgi:hypothetical protein